MRFIFSGASTCPKKRKPKAFLTNTSSCLEKSRMARGTTRECKSHKNTGTAPKQTSVMGRCHAVSVQSMKNRNTFENGLGFKLIMLWLIHPDSVDCS